MSERGSLAFAPLNAPSERPSVREWDLADLTPEAPPPPPPSAPPEPEPDPAAEAQARADALEAALSAARAEGYAHGIALARTEWAGALARIDALCAALPDAWERFCAAQRPPLTRVAVAAAERIVHAQLTLEPERIRAIVAAALAPLAHSTRVQVFVHPDDLALLTGDAADDGATFHPDPALARGGCRVECAHGAVDATREGARARLESALCDGDGAGA